MCVCVTADHNQYIFDRQRLSHRKNTISFLGKFEQKSQAFLRGPLCIAVYQAPVTSPVLHQRMTALLSQMSPQSLHEAVGVSRKASALGAQNQKYLRGG